MPQKSLIFGSKHFTVHLLTYMCVYMHYTETEYFWECRKKNLRIILSLSRIYSKAASLEFRKLLESP